ncbi:MAG: hypothetical protein KatS3mg054_0007 [Chloroflexus sp.]|nr:MAG: hypothetical protein KatS3mg054_0007 [Chloroflexus sp.]
MEFREQLINEWVEIIRSQYIPQTRHAFILKAPPSFGKCRTAMIMASELVHSRPIKAIILTRLIKSAKITWTEQLNKWFSGMFSFAFISCAALARSSQNLHKAAQTAGWDSADQADVLIFDEYHNITEVIAARLWSVKCCALLLSATATKEKDRLACSTWPIHTFLECSIQDTRRAGLTPEVKIIKVYLPQPQQVTWQVRPSKKAVCPPVTYGDYMRYYQYQKNSSFYISGTLNDYAAFCSIQKDYLMQHLKDTGPGKWKAALAPMMNLKRMLSATKVNYLIHHAPQLRWLANRCLIFTMTISEARILSQYGYGQCIHSKQNAKINEAYFHQFNTHQINSLISVNMLSEMVNLKDLRTSLFIQCDKSPIRGMQKFGRLLRSTGSTIYVFVYENMAHDEKYFKTFLSNLDLTVKDVIETNVGQLCQTTQSIT